MKIEPLRQIIAVAEYGSINRAARELYVSQPNLSIAIKKLEKEIGFDIFERTNQGMIPTPEGEKFISSAKIAVKAVDNLSAFTKKNDEKKYNKMAISIPPYRYIINAVCDVYGMHDDENLHFSIITGSRDEIIENVAGSRSELGVLSIYSPFYDYVMGELQAKHIHFVRFGELPLSILVGEHNELYKIDRDWVTIEDLNGMSFVGLDELEYGTYSTLTDMLGFDENNCSQRLYCSSWNTITDILRNTDCFTIAATNRLAYSQVPYYDNIRSLEFRGTDITNIVGWICCDNFHATTIQLELLQNLTKYF